MLSNSYIIQKQTFSWTARTVNFIIQDQIYCWIRVDWWSAITKKMCTCGLKYATQNNGCFFHTMLKNVLYLTEMLHFHSSNLKIAQLNKVTKRWHSCLPHWVTLHASTHTHNPSRGVGWKRLWPGKPAHPHMQSPVRKDIKHLQHTYRPQDSTWSAAIIVSKALRSES